MLCLVALTLPSRENISAEIQKSHALSMYGDIKYSPDFNHFDYVNPNAPKGGEIKFHEIGSFDTLNNFILKGSPAVNLSQVHDSLLTQSFDEPFTCLLYTSPSPRD